MENKNRLIVLGGNGFIGRNLCQYLVKQGWNVYSFDRKECKTKISGVNYILGDFCNDKILKNTIMDKDVIVHAISSIIPGNSNDSFLEGYGTDFMQTIKICSWIKDTNKKLVFLSSGGTVYGVHNKDTLNEEVIPKPINHYGNVKLSIENALRIFHIQNDMNVIIARISNPYGPGQDFTRGVGFIDAVLKKSINNELVEIWGDGNTIRDYIYIEDVCRILYKLICYQGNEYLFNVSSGVGTSQKEIIEIVQKLSLDVRTDYKPARSVDVRKIILDNSKVKEISQMKLLTIEEGIEKYYRYLCEIGKDN